jgi:hypothetical protein
MVERLLARDRVEEIKFNENFDDAIFKWPAK